MDRVIVYPSAIPQDIDLLNTNKNAMIALGYLIQATLGSATLVDGLSCQPTSPATMTVTVATGSIIQIGPIDATAYGSLSADTADQVMKQGIVIGATSFGCPAPTTSGQSVVYLIQAQYQDVDGGAVVLPYYNASNPSVPYSGPGNAGTPNDTVRQGRCILTRKDGTPAATGSQTIPTPDAGYVGLWAITVANGQTTITSGNINAYSGAPFIGNKLTAKLNADHNLSDVASASTALANLGGAPLNNPMFTGVVSATATAGTNAQFRVSPSGNGGIQFTNNAGTTQVANFAVDASGNVVFSGNGLGSTASIPTNDNSSKVATTAFVQGLFSNQSLASSGYQKLPGGLIVQWGSVVVSGGSATVTFPIAFPNAIFGAFLGYYWPSNAFISVNTDTPTLTGMTLYNGISYSNGSNGPTATNKYFAIGN